jgi:uncharacterized protein (TIGR03084 family)
VTSSVATRLITDLADEKDWLATLLRERAEADWDVPTPAPRWTVRDQVAHLAHFDGVTRLAIQDPAAFISLREGIADLQAYVDGVGPANQGRRGTDMLAWWQAENSGLIAAASAADPSVRVPWFGPAMALASKLTARLMEIWAHGQDVADALGVVRPASTRLEHVARIGVLTLPNSFRTRGLEVPSTPVRVDLLAPDGATRWTWGPDDATDVVRGDALDFCLVATQRRHVADTALAVEGRVAADWMRIAQTFAGPPGAGRRPGHFA